MGSTGRKGATFRRSLNVLGGPLTAEGRPAPRAVDEPSEPKWLHGYHLANSTREMRRLVYERKLKLKFGNLKLVEITDEDPRIRPTPSWSAGLRLCSACPRCDVAGLSLGHGARPQAREGGRAGVPNIHREL